MVINMAAGATEAELQHVIDRIVECGFQPHVTRGAERAIVAAVGSGGSRMALEALKAAPGVEDVVPIAHPFKLVSRQVKSGRTQVNVGGVIIGGEDAVVIAGPCSVESREQIFSTARAVKAAGATLLRGGAYKPRTSPYDFQGLGIEALRLLREVREATGLPVVTEVMSTNDIQLISDHADMLQVGARNMQNFNLLRQLGQLRKPILLKRGIAATIEELLLSAEYIMSGGNYDVILCERGIRTFETSTRNTMDISAIPIVKSLSHLPIIADPSHGTGRRDKVLPMARAAVAAGADGLLVEVHHDPDHALSDGAQSLRPAQFAELMQQLRLIAPAVGRTV
jgi:3-deoxy-7-phosphoheptulonate synthase